MFPVFATVGNVTLLLVHCAYNVTLLVFVHCLLAFVYDVLATNVPSLLIIFSPPLAAVYHPFNVYVLVLAVVVPLAPVLPKLNDTVYFLCGFVIADNVLDAYVTFVFALPAVVAPFPFNVIVYVPAFVFIVCISLSLYSLPPDAYVPLYTLTLI